MAQISEIPNYRQIKVKFVAPTNHNGARVKIWENKRYSDQKNDIIFLPLNYEISDVQQQCADYLKEKGFNIVGRASEVDYYILFVDNWGDEFINLKGELQ